MEDDSWNKNFTDLCSHSHELRALRPRFRLPLAAYEVNGTRTQLISPVLKLTWNESSPRGFAECLQMPLTGRAEEPAHISKAIEIPSETTDFQENVGRRSLTPFYFSFWCR